MAYKPGFDKLVTRFYYHFGPGSIRSDREIESRCVEKTVGFESQR